jgi:eukaryotic-like serine/threonine-protein kinase
VGDVIAGRYRLDGVLATGGFGGVYHAEDLQSRQRVALKLMFLETDGFPVLATRMEREGQLGRHLAHKNLVRAFDYGTSDDGCPFVVTELIAGRTLRDLMREGPLPIDRVLRIAKQLFEGLAACHALGVVHRDLKPRNVMVDEDAGDHLTIIDFGLAKSPAALLPRATESVDDDDLTPHKKLTEDGVVFGTLAYMAPETSQGMSVVDARSDLYAAGVVLYELYTGKHPFDASDPAELFHQHRSLPPPPFAERAPEVFAAPDFEGLVMRLLAKTPSDRHASAAEALAEIERLIAPKSIVPASIQPRSRLSIAMALLAAVMALVLIRALTKS